MNGARPVRCDNAHRGRRKLRRSRSIQLRYRIACTWHANEPRPSSRSSRAFFFFLSSSSCRCCCCCCCGGRGGGGNDMQMYALGVGKRFFIDSLPGQGENENKTIMKRNKNEILIAAADSRNYETGLFVCFVFFCSRSALDWPPSSIRFRFNSFSISPPTERGSLRTERESEDDGTDGEATMWISPR